MMKLLLLVGSIAVGLYLLLDYFIASHLQREIGWVFLTIFFLMTSTFLCITYFQWARKVNTYAILYHIALVVCVSLFCISTKTDFALSGSLVLLFTSVCFQIEFPTLIILTLLNLAGYVACLLIGLDTIEMQSWGGVKVAYSIASISALYLGTMMVILIMRWKIESLLKHEFISGTRLDSNSAIAKDLLSLLLPKFVLDKVQNFFEISDKSTVFHNQGDITILFCDIADFDEVVRRNESNIVSLLDRIFRKFDDLCVLHGIQKIETVGKTYMAAGGLDAVENLVALDLKKLNPTLRTLNLAKDMMEHIHNYEGLNLKIGIHVGKPVIGVIGYHKPQFSLIGDVVNTTSRHCTTGKVGHIMMSKDAWEFVKSSSALSKGYSHEAILTDMKGKGQVEVYHLFPKKNQFYSLIQNVVGKAGTGKNQEANIQRQVLTNMVNKIALAKKSQNSAGGRLMMLVKQMVPESFQVFHQIRHNLEAAVSTKPNHTLKRLDETHKTHLDIGEPSDRGNFYHKVEVTEAEEEIIEGEVTIL